MTVLHVQYRIILPYTLEQYNICQLYAASTHALKENTSDTKIEILENSPTEHAVLKSCQYTKKKYNIKSKVPDLITKIITAKEAFEFTEISYNAYPICNTTYTNNYFKPETFKITIDTINIKGFGSLENNIFKYDKKIFDGTIFVDLNIGTPYGENKTNLEKGWREKGDVITSYKFVTFEMNKFGLGWICYNMRDFLGGFLKNVHVESYIDRDSWMDLKMEDIRKLEAEVKKKLEEEIDKTKEKL